MKKRIHYYTCIKSAWTWLMAAFLCASVVLRIYNGFTKLPENASVWAMIVLPAASSILYALICLLDGKERFYKSAIPVWLTAIYYCLLIASLGMGKLTTLSFCICAVFFALIYQLLTSMITGRVWLLVPIQVIPIAAMIYLFRCGADGVLSVAILPDGLMFLGWLCMILGLKVHPVSEYHPTWGDRPDGRKLRTMSPIDMVSPYIMVNRNTANNLFEETLQIDAVDRYIRKKRKEGLNGFGLNHVLLAACVRGISQYPAINRFISGQKVFSRDEDIQYCMTVKKEMRIDSPDTVIKLHLNPRDTADDIYRKLSGAIDEVRNTPLDSGVDNAAQILTMIPGLFLKFAVWLLKTLDYFGLLPGFLLEVSPFHGSIYFTSMGSLGIPPVFHHLYDFGNLPVFGAFGNKYWKNEIDDDGNVVTHKYVDIKFDLDERIVDGYYYASFFRYIKRIIAHPEVLDNPPETVVRDID